MHASSRPTTALRFDGTLGCLPHPKVMPPGGTFRERRPSTRNCSRNDPAVGLAAAGLPARRTVAARRYARLPRPSYQGGPVSRRNNGLSDRGQEPSVSSNTRPRPRSGAPCGPALGPGVSRMVVVTEMLPTANSVYLLPTRRTQHAPRLSQFPVPRCHSLLVNAESRWSVFTHVDAAVFLDAGNVDPR